MFGQTFYISKYITLVEVKKAHNAKIEPVTITTTEDEINFVMNAIMTDNKN